MLDDLFAYIHRHITEEITLEELEKVLDTQGDVVETQADPLTKSITVPGRCIQVLESTGNPVRKGKKRKEK